MARINLSPLFGSAPSKLLLKIQKVVTALVIWTLLSGKLCSPFGCCPLEIAQTISSCEFWVPQSVAPRWKSIP
eukprot:6170915-Amphidinium_carterae.1